jgi:hypothetical protein
MAGEPDISSVGDALEGLVHQFADPWAFLRELIQNAIDAGSGQIEVRIDHDEARGTMTIEVVDSGEGMTREIIDTRLTRLFSSTKEGDYTKIGRFGIGFVSVFALDPEIVCVDTGRAGEYWRVLFRRDRASNAFASRARSRARRSGCFGGRRARRSRRRGQGPRDAGVLVQARARRGAAGRRGGQRGDGPRRAVQGEPRGGGHGAGDGAGARARGAARLLPRRV